MIQTIAKNKLKTHMLRIFRNINRPVLRISPIKEKKSLSDAFKDIKGKVIYHEDINTSTQSEWGEH